MIASGVKTRSGKPVPKVKPALTKRAVDPLVPADKPWIAWDDKLVGFGVRVQPSGVKTFIVNYRAGDGGRKAPNKRLAIGRHGQLAPTRPAAAGETASRPHRRGRREHDR